MTEIKIAGTVGSWELDPADIVAQINSAKDDIELFIDSPGGVVVGGYSIYNALKSYQNGKVYAKIDAVAASIASYIAMVAEEIEVQENSIFMIHNAWLPAMGDHRELRKVADIAEALTNIIALAYNSKTGEDIKVIQKMMDEESYFFGKEIVDAGFADRVSTSKDNSIDKAAAYALMSEKLKSCNNSIYKHANEIDLSAAAKLVLPKAKNKEDKKAVLSAKSLRDIQIFEREVLV